MAHLGVAQSNGHVGAQAGGVDGAALRIQARGKVHGQQRQPSFLPSLPHASQHLFEPSLDRPCRPRTQDGIDDQRSSCQVALQQCKAGIIVGGGGGNASLLCQLQLRVRALSRSTQVHLHPGAPLVKVAGSNQAVSTVVARAHQYQHSGAAWTLQELSGLERHAKASALHEGVDRYPIPGRGAFQRPHLLHRNNFHSGNPVSF